MNATRAVESSEQRLILLVSALHSEAHETHDYVADDLENRVIPQQHLHPLR